MYINNFLEKHQLISFIYDYLVDFLSVRHAAVKVSYLETFNFKKMFLKLKC